MINKEQKQVLLNIKDVMEEDKRKKNKKKSSKNQHKIKNSII